MKQKLEIKSFDDRGKGVGTGVGIGSGAGIGKEELHIPFVYPGDVVEAELINRRKQIGRLISLVSLSPERQDPPCQYFGHCGGCAWQGLKYEAQLKHKEAKVRALFGDVSPILPSPETTFYRNRMDFAFGPHFSAGLKDDRDNIINIDKCWLMSDKSNAILNRLRYFVSLKKLENYKAGIMRHAVVREGKNINNTIVNILTSDKGSFPLEEFWEKNRDLLQGVLWSINHSPADRSYGEIQGSAGKDYLLESLAGITFKIPAQSFFQTNTKQAENLLKIVAEFAALQGHETVLDLFCGTGSIGLSLAKQAKQVIGIEENQPAVELSKENAALNDITNFSALAGRVEDILNDFAETGEVVILDPPRPGVHKKALKKLAETRPAKIVYVSCNPVSQKQDVDLLMEAGYKIEKCQPLDMFPHTPHIENIILLK